MKLIVKTIDTNILSMAETSGVKIKSIFKGRGAFEISISSERPEQIANFSNAAGLAGISIRFI